MSRIENKEERKMLLERLQNLVKDNKRLLFTNLVPSQSGMSRTFNIYAQTKEGLVDITYLVANITQNTYTNKGKMRIHGCGMDMLFETCYQLNSAWIHLNNLDYNHDNQYNGLVETHYDLI